MELRKGVQGHPIRTLYFGGGTPSILSIDNLARIVDGLHRCFDLSSLEEMTLEANPEDLSLEYLAGLHAMGFNRLSIGVQSLDDSILRLLNRRHTAQQAIESIHNAQASGFDNISVDFIYGLPGGEAGFSDFPGVISDVTHVSAYSLTVEPGTALAVQVERGMVQLPDEDEVVRQYHALHRRLTEAGFRQYEVSNYARPGYESKHNSRYWDRTPYLGLGPAAHSFDGTHRWWNSPLDAKSGRWTVENEETLTSSDTFNEMLMTSLRTTRGLPLAAVPEGQKERLQRLMQPYIDCGWIILSNHHYIPTEEGLLHADGIAAGLFVDKD